MVVYWQTLGSRLRRLTASIRRSRGNLRANGGNMTSSPTEVLSDGGLRPAGKSSFVTAQDGLRLHVREYGPRTALALPAVCLPGLARTVADFDALAPALANGQPSRRLIAIDSRGRGQSDYDSNPENYNLAVELGDVVTVLTALEIGEAVFIGSSRGGLLTMLLGVAHPTAVAGVVLHDIGPVIEPKGLARIKSYVGKLPQPRNLGEGAEILRRLFDAQFPRLTGEQWLAAAQRTWKMDNGELVPTYDVELARTLAELDIERPLPAMWTEFDALSRVPILVIHGANSDILSADTVTAMHARHPTMESIEIADQGHVPLLDSPDLIRRVAKFVCSCDAARSRVEAPGKGANSIMTRATSATRQH
jgi:pimeloyl-ACP methyl ester carboxylesterase